MATLIELESGRRGYRAVLDEIQSSGRKRSPRGMPTLDLGHTTLVTTPFDALPIGVGRSVKPAIAAAEALQLIGGVSKAKLITRIEPAFTRFQEDDGRFHGAYGKRIGNQVEKVIKLLKRDPDSRQAVVQIWNHYIDLDSELSPRDVPCTVALGFTVVDDDHLDCDVIMRSNDAWLGLPYDLFQFTQLQLTVAAAMGLRPGAYRHTAWSMHLYERDLEKINFVKHSGSAEPSDLPVGIGKRGMSWTVMQMIAAALLDGAPLARDSMTESELWYQEQLEPYKEET